MTLTCWNCQQPGHVAADCLYKRELAPRPPRPPVMRDPDPPNEAYLQERQRLGMTSSGPDVLSVACPWCKAGPRRRCLNTGIGTETDPHYARQEAAGVARPSVRLVELAREQVRESRSSRLAAF